MKTVETMKEGIRTTGIPSREELEASPGYPSAEALASRIQDSDFMLPEF